MSNTFKKIIDIPIPDDAEVERIQSILGLVIPSSLTSFLKAHAGEFPEKTTAKIGLHGPFVDVATIGQLISDDFFYELRCNRGLEFCGLEFYEEFNRFGDRLVCFADEGCGGVWAASPTGSVYFIDPERFWDDYDADDEFGIHKCSDSIESFFGLLES